MISLINWSFVTVSAKHSVLVNPLHFARQTNSGNVIPEDLTKASGLQQSSMDSSYHLQTPFHCRRGSISNAFNTIAKEARPQ
jgi:hypothetical protein